MEATTTITAITHDHESNKENIPPVFTKVEKKKNKKNPIAPSFKKNTKWNVKRIPLADITHLFNNSAQLTVAQNQNGVSAFPSSVSVMLHSSSRRRTMVVVPGSKSLRMGFR